MDRRPIELRIREVGQLFESLDPLPFRERDLDKDVEDYVVGWAREMPPRSALDIVVHLPRTEAAGEAAAHIPDAIRNYFAYRVETMAQQRRELFRFGRVALLIGLAVLALCMVLAALARRFAGDSYLALFFQEGLVILGWVANWRPVEIFLYDWWPLERRRRLFGRLASANIRLAAY